MGGIHTLNTAIPHPELFAYVGVLVPDGGRRLYARLNEDGYGNILFTSSGEKGQSIMF